ncbi:MAG: hypothetical protein JSU09_06415 [Bacteroidetes bacterium]|nr:hypothetical protein [Bacteroidota bacterium]
MRKLLNIGAISSVRLAVLAYTLVNIFAFLLVSNSVVDSQHFSLSTESLKSDCSFFICNESEKDGEDDDYQTQFVLASFLNSHPFSQRQPESIAPFEFDSITHSSETYLYNCSLLL